MKRGSMPRRRGLAWRLASRILLSSLLVIILLSVAVYFTIALYLDRQLEDEIDAQARFYAGYAASLASDESTLAGLAVTVVGQFAPQADLTVRVFAASSGTLLAATQDIGPQPSGTALVETGVSQSNRVHPVQPRSAQPPLRGPANRARHQDDRCGRSVEIHLGY